MQERDQAQIIPGLFPLSPLKRECPGAFSIVLDGSISVAYVSTDECAPSDRFQRAGARAARKAISCRLTDPGSYALAPGWYIWDSSGSAEPQSADGPLALFEDAAWRDDCRALGPWLSLGPEAEENDWWRAAAPPPAAPVVLTPPCASSLDLAMSLPRTGRLPEWGAVLPVSQWAGRGQAGRTWSSPPGNLYAAWQLPAPPPAWRGFVSLLLGAALRAALAEHGLALTLKWPNDLWWKSRKLAGLLVVERGGRWFAGLGLNLISRPSDEDVLRTDGVPAACLAESGWVIRPAPFWAWLIPRLRAIWDAEIAAPGPAALAARLVEHLAFVGQDIILSDACGDARPVRVLGLHASGGLRVLHHGREEVVYSGRLRPRQP